MERFMNRLPGLSRLLIAGVLLLSSFSGSFAGMVVDPEALEFTVPQEVSGRAVLNLANTEGPVLRYEITSKISAGFRARYYNNAAGASPQFGELVLERQDATINNNWQANGPQNGVGNDNFGAIWEGIFIAPENARYAFRTNTDDGVRFYVDGQRVINDWVNHNPTPRDWSGQLSFGPHRIRMEYYEDRNNAVAQLSWQQPGGQMVIMPGQSERGWIDMQPSHGSIAAGTSVDIAITVETRSLESGGEYSDTIFVNSNDRDNPVIRIPVTVSVTPWQPGAVIPSARGVARNMQPNAREQSQLTLRSVGRGNYDYQATIDGNDRAWLTVAPAAGSIAPGQEGTINLNFNSTARGRGLYNATLVLTGNDERNPTTRIPVTMAIGVPFGTIFGRVVDHQSEEPIGGADVGAEGFGYVTVADENGAFELPVPVRRHQLWAMAPDYLRYLSDEVAVDEGERVEINPSLRQGTFSPVLRQLELSLAPEDTLTFPLAVRNRGNGDVSWRGEVVFAPENLLRPWQEQLRFDVSREGLDDNRINGVEFIDGHFYVSGGNEGRGFGKIYVFDSEGGFVRDFDQFLEGTAFGMRDLAWDGELLWGSDNGRMYGFDLEGNLQIEFQGPINPCRALACDSDGTIWISDNQSDLYHIDREGDLIERIRNPGGRRFGLAWYAEDPDGFPLYMFTNDNADHVIAIQKYSPAANQLRFVTDLEGEATDRAGGLGITGTWDPYSWSLVAQMNSAVDAIAVYHLASRTGWIGLVVDEGLIEAGEIGSVGIFINSAGLLAEEQYEAGLRFNHDGIGGEVIVPLTVTVTNENGASERIIPLSTGWNLISTNILPEGRDDFVGLMRPLTDEGALILAKDGAGNFFWPGRNFDNIDAWESQQGYWLKLSSHAQLHFTGEPVAMETPIDLGAGWNTVSYLPRIPAGPDVALANLAENLVIARDGFGRFYLPAYNFTDMDVMREGNGFQLKVREAAELIYGLDGAASRRGPRYSSADLEWLHNLPATESMHNLLVQSSLQSGTRLEAFTPAGLLSGRGVVGEDGFAGLTLWGDDQASAVCDGFVAWEEPVLKIVGIDGELPFAVKDGLAEWSSGGWGVVALAETILPLKFAISAAYPNPFNSALNITFTLAETGEITLRVFDLTGRAAGTLVSGNLKAGVHRAEWNAEAMPSGIYMLRLESAAKKVSQKVLLVK